MEKFFPEEKIMINRKPCKSQLLSESSITRTEGMTILFSWIEIKKTVLVVGGSLGAKSINEAIDNDLDELLNAGLQLIWQTGKPYLAKAKERAAGKQAFG